ncbi:methyltransferase domain-containing protein [Saccharopolyspora thermophila]|nr:methyltransferase domain-containing protein [Saccharopolyspora subtropica]
MRDSLERLLVGLERIAPDQRCAPGASVPNDEQRDRQWCEVTAESDPERWLAQVYANKPLVTQLGELHHGGIGPTSSSSSPALMARMLEVLDVRDGHRVCEIGTGTGWNYALLAHRLGPENVYSVDLDGELVEQARENIRRVGYEPNLAAADGAEGWPGGGLFDRFIATCAVNRIPAACIEQTREGGIILADLKVYTSTGNLVPLRRTENGAEGHFVDGFSAFMLMRGETHPPISGYPDRDRRQARHRYTSVREQRPWEAPV